MSVNPEDPIGGHRGPNHAVSYALATLAGLIAAITIGGSIAGVVFLSRSPADASEVAPHLARLPGAVTGIAVAILAGLLVVGLVSSGLLVVALAFSRRFQSFTDRLATIEQHTAFLAEQSIAQGKTNVPETPIAFDPAEWRALLTDIRETLLLPPEERTRRYEEMVSQQFERRLNAAASFVGAREFHKARHELAKLVERFGMDPRVKQAQVELENAAEAARTSDIEAITTRVEDLMALASWDNAEASARELAAKYPLSDTATALVERIGRERRLFEQKHRQRMQDEIQQFVTNRRWREALDATRLFVEAFPVGADTDALRSELATLEANADIQERQALEGQLKSLVRDRQYWEAMELARRIIADHPLSPQANALRTQLPRLEELARQHQPQR